MNDAEIIKALEYCVHHKDCDDGCPCVIAEKPCVVNDPMKLFNLIKRQQAEIERLNTNMDSMVAEHNRLIKNTKSEAIKEFAEKLKATFPDRQDSRCTLDDCYTLDIIDNLAKEMTGGENNGT